MKTKVLSIKSLGLLVLILGLGAFLTNCSKMKDEMPVPSQDLNYKVVTVNGIIGSNCTDIMAGQDILAGNICLTDDGSSLTIEYNTSATDWELLEIHFWIGDSFVDIPQTRKGNPIPGQFPVIEENLPPGTNTYTITYTFDELGFNCENPHYLYVAAHCVVGKPDLENGGYIQTETGWGTGVEFPWKNWAEYFTIAIDCGGGGGDDTEPCETGFAYGDLYATCFTDIPGEEISRWGWTNGPLSEGNYDFDIYTGAGQCDLSKGTYVGVLNVVYSGGTANITYTMEPGFILDETQLYVGNDILPTDENGDFTVAPGQYGNIHDDLNGATSDQYTINYLSGDIYVVAHAVVCEYVAPPCDETVGLVYGMRVEGNTATGEIWQIDVPNQTAIHVFTSTLADLDNNSTPNGLAYDGVNNRLYYANYKTSDPKDLFFWDGTNEVNAGTLSLENSTAVAQNAAADFYDGKYYYILSLPHSDDLYEVSFDADGYITSQSKLADISDDVHGWEFYGDIAIKEGILYGWGLCKAHNKYEFFKYDLSTNAFTLICNTNEVNSGVLNLTSLQLAFGSNGDILYGHDYYSGAFRTIDISTGVVSNVITIDPIGKYTDCASGQQCY